MNSLPEIGIGHGSLKRRNPLTKAALFGTFHMYRVWCAVRRKVTDRTVRPRQLVGEMLAEPPLSNKTIWVYWDRGWEAMPPLSRLSVESWRARNPGWDVRFLDKDEALALTGIPPEVAAKRMKPAHFADMVRLELLTQFGGVWADATTFCEIPLDDWLYRAMPYGFFAFTVTEQKTVENWFLAAEKGNPIIKAWRDLAYTYWSCADRPTTYLMFYDLFSLAMASDKTAGRMWRFSTKIERMQQHVMRHRYLDRQACTDFEAFRLRGMMPMHKFSFKEPVPDHFAGTPFAQILGLESRAELEERAGQLTL